MSDLKWVRTTISQAGFSVGEEKLVDTADTTIAGFIESGVLVLVGGDDAPAEETHEATAEVFEPAEANEEAARSRFGFAFSSEFPRGLEAEPQGGIPDRQNVEPEA